MSTNPMNPEENLPLDTIEELLNFAPEVVKPGNLLYRSVGYMLITRVTKSNILTFVISQLQKDFLSDADKTIYILNNFQPIRNWDTRN